MVPSSLLYPRPSLTRLGRFLVQYKPAMGRDLLLWYESSDASVEKNKHNLWSAGIYLVLFCICVYILVHRPRNLANTILLITAIVLFSLATVQAVINLVLGAADIDNIQVPYYQLVDATSVVYSVNNFVADGLVIYRCYAVWNNNVWVTIMPILMLIAVTVLGIDGSFDVELSAYPFLALTLATNVLVTILTGKDRSIRASGRIWWIYRYSRTYLKETERRRYASAMEILIESGMLYSATVLTYMIVISIPSVAILGEPIFQMLIQIMGIAPTLIIVRAGLGVKDQELKDCMRSQTRPILRMRMRQTEPGKEMPTIPLDVEKGAPELLVIS
ncbi:hypothetical protein K438DRAFT_1785314 [Mycena galopus ATCC 62051]|nr:hypothetical protein K438DRAFT_1785314 [Mycena galopus ATCC 62051]